MRFRSAFALSGGPAIAEDDDVRIEVASEDAERLAVGRPGKAAAALLGRVPDCTGLRDIFCQGVRVRMGGMISS